MANLITAMLLKVYGPSLPNRDESGEAKQIIVENVPRARFSPQSFTRAIKEYMGDNIKTIRTAHLEDLIEAILIKMAEEGTIKPEQIDFYGNIICKPKKKEKKEKDKEEKKEDKMKDYKQLFDCSWDERKSVGGDRSEDAKDNKGRTMTVISPDQLYAVINAVVSCPEDTKPADYEKAANKALENVHISADQALFGTMATSGVLGTIPSAVYKADSYSIDALCPENDYITASFMEQGTDDTDPFYGNIKNFAEAEKSVARADAITSSWLYSNTMYSKTAVDIDILRDNLTRNPVGGHIQMPADEITKDSKEKVYSYIEAFANAVPSGSMKRHVSAENPGILYIESTKNGGLSLKEFGKVIKSDEKGTVMEHGIDEILGYAQNPGLRRGNITKYVYLDMKYRSFEKAFEEAGVTVVRNLDDLEKALNAEVERLS